MDTKSIILCAFVAVAIYASVSTAADVDCDVRPPFIDPKTCCEMPELITDEIKEQCKEFMEPPASSEDEDSSRPRPRPRPHPPHHHGRHHHGYHPRFVQCVLNVTGIVDDNSKLNEDKVTEYLAVALKDSDDMIPVVEQAFKTCEAKREAFKAKMPEFKKNRSSELSDGMTRPKCRGGFLLGCVFMESFKNCAPSQWNDTDECNELRDFMVNCKPKRWRKHGGHPGSKESTENSM